jgi:hypothetical protein
MNTTIRIFCTSHLHWAAVGAAGHSETASDQSAKLCYLVGSGNYE